MIDKIRKFMYGRYGTDEVYKFLFGVYFILLFVNLFIRSEVITYVELFIIFIMFYRVLSKNAYARRKENAMFLEIRRKVLKPFKNVKRRVKDKNHIYKKCKKCKTVLKLPLPEKIGIKHAKCPECKCRVRVLALRREKIEIIRKVNV